VINRDKKARPLGPGE